MFVVALSLAAVPAIAQTVSPGAAGDAACGISIPVGTPFLIAVISARIEIAISDGVLLPMYSPIGPCRRASCSGVRSNSSSRSRRLLLFSREPIAPT